MVRRLAVVALGAALCGLLVYLNRSSFRLTEPDYRIGNTAGGTNQLMVVAPLVAGFAAHEAARLRRGTIWAVGHVRATPAIIARAIAGAVLIGCVGLLVAWYSGGVDWLWYPDPTFAAVAVAVVVGYALAGCALGIALPAPLAVSIAAVGSYLWTAFPPSWSDPIWVRHLTGQLACCTIGEAPADGAVAGTLLMTVALPVVVLAAALLWQRGRRLFLAVALVAAGAIVVLSTNLVSDLGAHASQPRDRTALVCDGTDPRVCAWPEHAERIATAQPLLARALAPLPALGIGRPETIDETGGRWSVQLQPNGSVREYQRSLLATMARPQPAHCANRTLPAEMHDGLIAQWAVHDYAAAQLGHSRIGVTDDIVERVLALPLAERRAWLARAGDLGTRCEIRRSDLMPAG